MGDDSIDKVEPASDSAGAIPAGSMQQLALPTMQQGVHVSFVQPAAIPPALSTPENVKGAIEAIDRQSERQHQQALARIKESSERRRQTVWMSFASLVVVTAAASYLGPHNPELLKELAALVAVALGGYGFAKRKKEE